MKGFNKICGERRWLFGAGQLEVLALFHNDFHLIFVPAKTEEDSDF